MSRHRTTAVRRIPSEPDAIRRQLERILESAYFQTSKQLNRFLQYVVEESLNGRGNRLRQYTIAVNALGRDPSFDPDSDPVIRIEARRLRQTLAFYYQHEGQHDPIRIEIPTGRYAPIFRRNWAATADQVTATAPHRGPPLVGPHHNAKGSEGPTIVLLDFTALDPEGELDAQALSLTEALAVALSRFEFIKLIRPVDPAQFQGDLNVKRYREEHGLYYLLDGVLQRLDGEARLLGRLRDPLSAEVLWSEHYPLTDTARLVTTLADFHGVALSHWSHHALRANELPEQHEVLSRVRYFYNRLDRDAFIEAWRACEQALLRWPDDPLVSTLLADLCVLAYFNDIGAIDAPLARAERLARDAVALRPNWHFSRFALGKVYFAKGEPGPCVAEFDRCRELNPHSATVIAWIGLYTCLLGDWELGEQWLQQSQALTPDSPLYHFALALGHYRRGDYETAWTEARRLHTPDLLWDTLLRVACLGRLGRAEEAQPDIEELLQHFPDFPSRGRLRLQRLLFCEEHVEMLWQGLQQAGLVSGER